MKAKTVVIVIVAALMLFGLVGRATQGQEAYVHVRLTAWEYKVSNRALGYDEKDFNNLGAKGWELVVAEHEIVNGRSSAVRYIYKRPKQ